MQVDEPSVGTPPRDANEASAGGKKLVYIGAHALSIQDAMHLLSESHYGALDPVEGAIWRIERDGKVDFLVKYVRPEKIDGIYLPEVTGNGATIWNVSSLVG